MKFGQWEHMDGGREFSPHREELPPPCQNGRHNLFWQIMYVGPVDAMDTVRDYGIFEGGNAVAAWRCKGVPYCRKQIRM